MNDFKEEYLRYLDANQIKYTDLDERIVRVTYGGDNMKTIPIIVAFDKDGGNRVQLSCFDIGSYRGEKIASGLIICNAMNAKYRWVKFYLDQDNDCRAEADAIVDMETVGPECHELVGRMITIIDEAYPEFMKAMWT